MFIPVGTYMQFIEQVDKDDAGNISSQKIMGVRVRLIQESFILLSINDAGLSFPQYVPLTDQDKQLGNISGSWPYYGRVNVFVNFL